MKKLCIFLVVLLLFGCASFSKRSLGHDTYYVTAQGSDRNDGLSRDTPFRSLFRAMAAAANGPIKTITVLGTLDVTSEQSSNNERVFFIQSMGKDEILIRGLASGSEPAVLSAEGSGRRAVLIRGTAPIRFEFIVISGGTSSGEGGGMGIGPGSAVTLGPGAIIRDNRSDYMGGGIITAPGASLFVEGGKILNNRSGAVGGGIAVMGSGGKVVFSEGEISGNHALGGGAIAVYQGSICTLSGGVFFGNNASLAGGGVMVNQGGVFNMEGGIIRDNRSSGSGGGIAVLEGGQVFVKNGEIHGNQAAEHGGGIASDDQSALTIEGGAILVNRAASWGGGIFSAGSFIKSGGKIYGNDAPEDGANTAIIGPAVFAFRRDGRHKILKQSAGENFALNADTDDNWAFVEEEQQQKELEHQEEDF